MGKNFIIDNLVRLGILEENGQGGYAAVPLSRDEAIQRLKEEESELLPLESMNEELDTIYELLEENLKHINNLYLLFGKIAGIELKGTVK